jgi:polyferredoxin
MRNGKWIRWLGSAAATAAIVVLVMNSDYFTGSRLTDLDILLYLGLAILPCFISIFLFAFGRFWWGFPLGLWISFTAVMTFSIGVFDEKGPDLVCCQGVQFS